MTRTVPPTLKGLHIGQDKLVGYLLDPTHPQGGPKAAFLLRFGFDAEHPHVLARALTRHFLAAPSADTRTDDFGAQRIVCEGPIPTPDGRDPLIRSVWVLEPDDHGRLLTIVPRPRRSGPP